MPKNSAWTEKRTGFYLGHVLKGVVSALSKTVRISLFLVVAIGIPFALTTLYVSFNDGRAVGSRFVHEALHVLIACSAVPSIYFLRSGRLVRVVVAVLLVCVLYIATFGYAVSLAMGRPSLGISRGSISELRSKADGFYVGRYIPARRLVPLKDLSVIHVPDAWLEHAWKPKLSFLLQDRQVVTDGYYLYIPIYPDESIGSGKTWPFKFGLKLEQHGQQVSRYPGIGYDPRVGFPVFLDSVPETVNFIVEQKQDENDSWNDAAPVESIEFKRAF